MPAADIVECHLHKQWMVATNNLGIHDQPVDDFHLDTHRPGNTSLHRQGRVGWNLALNYPGRAICSLKAASHKDEADP